MKTCKIEKMCISLLHRREQEAFLSQSKTTTTMKEYFTGTPAQAVIVPQYADTVKVPVASWDEALKIQGNPSCNGEVLVYDKTGKLLGRWAESISGGFTVSNGDSYPKNTWGQPQKMRAYKSWKEKVAAIR